MKKYLATFMAGVLLTSGSLTVMAAVENYNLTKSQTPIYIQNVKYPTDALPVLNLELDGGNNTYVPLRNFSEMVGADVVYDSAQDKINISMESTSTSNSNSNTSTNTNTTTNGVVTLNTLDKTYNTTYNINVYTLDGKSYVETDEIDEYYLEDSYKLNNDDFDFEDDTYRSTGTINLEKNDSVVLADIEAIRTNRDYLISYDYFINSIYPLIQANSNTSSNNTNTNTNTDANANANTSIVSLYSLDKTYNTTYKVNVYTLDGKSYVETDEIDEYYFDDSYKIVNDEYDFEDDFYRNTGTIKLENNDKVVLDSIPAIKTTKDFLISYDYFVNTIYPIIK